MTPDDGLSPMRMPGRGSLLLLDHCARLDRLTSARKRSARERLEAELGADLAARLLGSLCGRAQSASTATAGTAA